MTHLVIAISALRAVSGMVGAVSDLQGSTLTTPVTPNVDSELFDRVARRLDHGESFF